MWDAAPSLTASEHKQDSISLGKLSTHSTISPTYHSPIFSPVTNEKGFEDVAAFIHHCTGGETEAQRGAVAAPDHLTRQHQEPPDSKSCGVISLRILLLRTLNPAKHPEYLQPECSLWSPSLQPRDRVGPLCFSGWWVVPTRDRTATWSGGGGGILSALWHSCLDTPLTTTWAPSPRLQKEQAGVG